MSYDNTKVIKNAIVHAHKWGKCDIDGNSVRDGNGGFKARPRPTNSTVKIYRWDSATQKMKEV